SVPNAGFARPCAHRRRREDPGPGERLRHDHRHDTHSTFVRARSARTRRCIMPELPDITVYIEALERRLLGARLESTRITHPFLLRTFDPPIAALYGRRVVAFRRVGKRIAIGFEGDHWLVLHLMIAGRLHWIAPAAAKKGRA